MVSSPHYHGVAATAPCGNAGRAVQRLKRLLALMGWDVRNPPAGGITWSLRVYQ